MPRTKQFDEQTVLERAVELFWKQGYHATSMQDLVDHLGINRASLYSTFGDKKQLFLRAVHHYRSENFAGLTDLLKSEPDIRVALRKLLDMAVTEASTDSDRKGCFIVNTTTELVPADEEIAQIVEVNKNQMEQKIFEYILVAQNAGQIAREKDAEAIASLIFTLFNGLRVVGKMDRDTASLEMAVEAALSVLD